MEGIRLVRPCERAIVPTVGSTHSRAGPPSCWLDCCCCGNAASAAQSSLARVIDQAQTKMVKIYGAGGFRGMEGYQSGFLISAEGHVLTALSYVLDTDRITVTLNDGRRYDAKLLGGDPRLEVAVLKIEAANLPHFDLAKAVSLDRRHADSRLEQPLQRGHGRRAGQRAKRHGLGAHATGRPSRRFRDALPRPDLRARRGHQ